MNFSPEQEAALLEIRRKKRFIEGYNEYYELRCLIEEFFTNQSELEQTGLRVAYEGLKNKVITYHLIGFILLGLNNDDIPISYNLPICKYITVDRKELTLTISSISNHLIDDYIKKENVDNLCRQCPNFKIYYNID